MADQGSGVRGDVGGATVGLPTGVRSGEVRTGDGVTIRYLEAGQGEPLVIVPGWSCTAATWRHQLEGLADRFRVIALDMRGHGRTDKPEHGYRISRLAADLREVLDALDLTGVTLMGHSLGCVMTWSYLDLFGPHRLRRLVLVDQPAVLARDPDWDDELVATTGAPFTAEQVQRMAHRLRGEEGDDVRRRFFAAMPTDQLEPGVLDWLYTEIEQLPARHAADLILDGTRADYRDLLPRITLPTLYVGGRVRGVRMSCQRWICEQIPDARHVAFTAEDRGSHLMYLENPTRFNDVVREFVAAT
jgi:pimeloyl-ACP methyl ester carboxylesterase